MNEWIPSAGGGFVSGAFVTILGVLGINRRLSNLENNVIYKDTFDQTLKRFESLEKTVKTMDNRIFEIHNKIIDK